jgi:hypothetical protein
MFILNQGGSAVILLVGRSAEQIETLIDNTARLDMELITILAG